MNQQTGQEERAVAVLFEAALLEWKAYKNALRNSDTECMRRTFDLMIKFLRILSLAKYQKELEAFIVENEMPRRWILRCIGNTTERQ